MRTSSGYNSSDDQEHSQRWQNAYRIFDRALDLPVRERPAFVATETSHDAELARVVERLLQESESEIADAPELAATVPSRIGQRIGRFEIQSLLGAGGNGQVFAAQDLELDRMVALKFVSGSGDLVRDLEQEARAASALNHPGIVTIFEVVRQNGEVALAMELVEGQPLRAYCGEPQPPASVARWGSQIAAALGAAHAGRIVHRDIKPENLMLRSDGVVKILDFGIARRIHNPSGAHDTTRFAGTWNYLSPEQAHSRPVGPSSDVFSLGVVLHELLSGSHPFPGDSPVDVAHAIAYRAANPLPRTTPPVLAELVESMLSKDAHQRPAASVVAEMLAHRRPNTGPSSRPWSGAPRGIGIWLRVVAAVAGIVLTGTVGLRWLKSAPGFSTASSFSLPPGTTRGDGFGTNIAISADGATIVYSSRKDNHNDLYWMKVGEGVSHLIAGTTDGSTPVLSADGQRLSFKRGPVIFETRLDGTAPHKLVATERGIPDFGLYTTGGEYYHTTVPPDRSGRLTSVISRMSLLNTHPPQQVLGLLHPNTPQQEWQTGVRLLPDGQLLVGVTRSGWREIWMADPRSGERKQLIRAAGPYYSPTGHLIYHRGNTLYAAPLDLNRREISGPEAAVRTGVASMSWAGGDMSVSENGTLVYFEGPKPVPDRTLMWVSLDGKETPLPVPPGPYLPVDLSPDGTLALILKYEELEATWSLWLMPTGATGEWVKVSGGHSLHTAGSFTADNEWVLFNRMGSGLARHRIRPALGPEEIIAAEPDFARFPAPPLPPHQGLLFVEGLHPKVGAIIYALPGMEGQQAPVRVRTGHSLPLVAPDGKWVATQNRLRINILPFPLDQDSVPIDAGVGSSLAWSPDGRTLYCVDEQNRMVALPFENGKLGHRTPLMDLSHYEPGTRWFSTMPLAKDGRRFLMARNRNPSSAPARTTIHVVRNWFDDIKRLAHPLR
jgi:serine/threonine protein kinase